MDRSTDWPWSWEEEVEWRVDLEERDYGFLQELIDNAMEDTTTDSRYSLGPLPEELSETLGPDEYFVTT